MRQFDWSGFGWLAFTLALSGCASGEGTVTGFVYETQREIAIEGGVVSIRSLEGGGEEQFALTDINGLYRFENVPEGLNRVTVVKEGYASTSGAGKIADVVGGELVTLDFPMQLYPLRIYRSVPLTVTDESGPVAGATVDFYTGPCLGKISPCVTELPTGNDLNYGFFDSYTTGEAGTVSIPIASSGLPVEEFKDYLFQFRITSPEHRNSVFDLRLNIDTVPASLQFRLARAS